MPEPFENNRRDFSIFDHMSTEALENILRADAQQLDEDTDIQAILYITGLLEERAKKSQQQTTDVERMLQQFKSDYLETNVAAQDVLYSDKETRCDAAGRKTGRRGHWRRFAVAIAAIFCLVVLTTGVATAFGVNIWGLVAAWTDDVFYFKNAAEEDTPMQPDDPSDQQEPEYTSLEDALNSFGIGGIADPALPEEFQLNYVNVVEDETKITIFAEYDSDVEFISVCIRTYNGTPATNYEKTDDKVEPFSIGRTACYAFYNTGNQTITWINGEYECGVNGTIPMEELKEVVASMITEK